MMQQIDVMLPSGVIANARAILKSERNFRRVWRIISKKSATKEFVRLDFPDGEIHIYYRRKE